MAQKTKGRFVFCASSKPLLSIAAPGSFVVGAEASSTVSVCGMAEVATLLLDTIVDVVVEVVDDVDMRYPAMPTTTTMTITTAAKIILVLDRVGLLGSKINAPLAPNRSRTSIL